MAKKNSMMPVLDVAIDGKVIRVEPEYGDAIAYELRVGKPKNGVPPMNQAPLVWMSWLGWHRLRKLGIYRGSFQTFCEEVEEVTTVEDDDADPTEAEPLTSA